MRITIGLAFARSPTVSGNSAGLRGHHSVLAIMVGLKNQLRWQ
jgi:hypothetical protein